MFLLVFGMFTVFLFSLMMNSNVCLLSQCQNLEVHAEEAYYLLLKCTSTEYDYQYVCYDVTLYANNAREVEMIGHHGYGIYSSELYVQNATSVTIDARGSGM